MRLLVHTLSKLKDFFLVETLLAILGNLSPHVYQLHSYSAERIVNITVMVLKNFETYSHKVQTIQSRIDTSQSEPTFNETNIINAENDENELSQVTPLAIVYGKCAQSLVGFLRVSTRSHQLRHNGQLTYSLMHKRNELSSAFAPFLTSTDNSHTDDELLILRNEVTAHASGLPLLLNYLAERISNAASHPIDNSRNPSSLPSHSNQQLIDGGDISSSSTTVTGIGAAVPLTESVRELSVKEIESILERACTTYQNNDEYEPLKVAYTEQLEPETFFVGYAWEIVHTHSSDLLF
jgi:hypothetical protein